MTDKNLFSAIGNIDEKYIEEAADQEKSHPRLLLLRYVAAAAAFLLVVLASIGIFANPPTKSHTDGYTSGATDINQDNEVTLNEDENLSSSVENADDSKSEADQYTAGIISTAPGGTKGGKYRMAQINFEDERFYRYISDNELSELNLKPINKDSLGEKVSVVTSKNCNLDFLIGYEIFSHKQIDCDAFLILKNGDELVPFIFLGFRYHDRDFSETLSLYGVDSSEDIEKITTRPGKPGMANEKTITDSSEIKAVYDILLSIHNDKGQNEEIKQEYHYNDEKTYIYFKLHFKNGLTYQSFYRVYNDKSYIEDHEFLTSEQDEILRNILLN